MRDPIRFPVDDPSRPGEVRRAAVALAETVGLSEDDQGRVAVVATELSTNLVKHATGGEVILRSLSSAEGVGIELLGLDRGPGIPDIGRCLQDGFSTTGTAGNGFGALARLSDLFDISSAPGVGTAIVTRFFATRDPLPPAVVGAVTLPVGGEEVCGDAWAVENVEGRTVVLVADGLGHGVLAATAANEAVRTFRRIAASEPTAILEDLNTALRPTRGAAAAVAVIDRPAGRLRYAGVGNIAGVIVSPAGRQGLVSLGGTLGHGVRKVQAFEYPWPEGGLLVMHSDGLGSQWDVNRYPGLTARHPALIGGVLYRDGRRERDDVTVVVVRDATEGRE